MWFKSSRLGECRRNAIIAISPRAHTRITKLRQTGCMDSVPASDGSGVSNTPGQLPRGFARRSSTTLKLFVIAVLILLLHVPLLFVWDTLGERQGLRDEAAAEIGRTWGAEQTVLGPVLAVPYTVTARVPRQSVVADRLVHSEELREVRGTAYFLPARFEATGTLTVSERHRGIFRVPVYVAELAIGGEFQPDTTPLGLDGATFEWNRARVVMDVSDPHGLRSAPVWRADEVDTIFAPAAPRAGEWGGMEAPVSIAAAGPGTRLAFRVTLALQGSGRLALVPVGESSTVALEGGWPDPSFDGGYLPAERTIGADGFSARWITTHFGRAFPSAWVEQPGRETLRTQPLAGSALGVTLATPVDTYRMVERALKYALLVLGLIFAVYFLFEVTSTVRVHPLQYLMVGGALVLFYLGFLALAEFVPVAVAYGSAAAASTLLVGGYSWSVLRAGRRSLLVGAGLAGTYGYVYFMLQLQDYALLAGTAALFALLGAAMWFTRRLDWAALDARPRALEPERG